MRYELGIYFCLDAETEEDALEKFNEIERWLESQQITGVYLDFISGRII